MRRFWDFLRRWWWLAAAFLGLVIVALVRRRPAPAPSPIGEVLKETVQSEEHLATERRRIEAEREAEVGRIREGLETDLQAVKVQEDARAAELEADPEKLAEWWKARAREVKP